MAEDRYGQEVALHMDVESIKERRMIGYWNEAGAGDKHVEGIDYKLL